MKKLKSFKVLLMIMILVIGVNTGAYAHKMIINPIEEGKIRVEYDGGNPATRSKISVYNSEDELVDEGDVDEDGVFQYDQKETAYLVADDGMGHKDTWEAGSNVESSDGSKLPKIAAVVVVLGAVALFFSKKK